MSDLPKDVQDANNILANMIKAAMADAIVEKKLSQFKLAIIDNTGPKFVRLIVVPEVMDRNWPAEAPLGFISKKEGA